MEKMLLILVCGVLCSCASVMNNPTTAVTIHTSQPGKIIIGNDSFQTVNNQVKTVVRRGKEPLRITTVTNSGSKTVDVKAKNSFAYYFNIPGNYGLGMLIDKNNPKRYTYPKHIYFQSEDSVTKVYHYQKKVNAGSVYLQLSFPYINSFYLHPAGESTQANTGFLGSSFALDYYYKNNRFITVSMAGALDFLAPMPAPVHFYGEHAYMSTAFLSLTNNHRNKRFLLGYGVQVSKNTWDLRYRSGHNAPPPSRPPIRKTTTSVGLVFPARYMTGEHFFIGMIYRPNLLHFTGPPALRYEHLISLEFGWKIKLNKG